MSFDEWCDGELVCRICCSSIAVEAVDKCVTKILPLAVRDIFDRNLLEFIFSADRGVFVDAVYGMKTASGNKKYSDELVFSSCYHINDFTGDVNEFTDLFAVHGALDIVLCEGGFARCIFVRIGSDFDRAAHFAVDLNADCDGVGGEEAFICGWPCFVG